MDDVDIGVAPGRGTIVTLIKQLTRSQTQVTVASIKALARRLMEQPTDVLEEVRQQNEVLLRSLEELRSRQEEMERSNRELAETDPAWWPCTPNLMSVISTSAKPPG